MRDLHVGRVQVCLVRQWGVLADLVLQLWDFPDTRHEVLPFVVRDQLCGDVSAQVDLDFPCDIGEVSVVHHGDDAEGDEQIEEAVKSATPRAQHTSHFLLMGGLCRRGVACANPACPVQNRDHDGDEHHHQVEIPHVLDVKAVEETFPRHAVVHDRDDLLRPAEFPQDEHHEHHHQREEHHPLDRIGDQHGKGAAEADQRDRQDQTDDNDQHETRDRDPEYLEFMRQIEEVNEEAGGDRRHDHIGKHFGDRAQGGSENTEFTVIAHFQELAQAHRPRFPKPVGAVAVQTQRDPQRGDQTVPERHGEPRFVMHFHVGDQTRDRQCAGHVAHTEHIPARAASRGKEIRHAVHILP